VPLAQQTRRQKDTAQPKMLRSAAALSTPVLSQDDLYCSFDKIITCARH